MVHKFVFTTMISVVLLSLTSCLTANRDNNSKKNSNQASKIVSKRFTVEPGSLEGTYLKEPWPSYEHNKNIKGLYYDKGVLLLLSEDNELIKLDLLNGLPYKHKLQLKSDLQYPPVVYQYDLNADNVEGGGSSELYLLQNGDILWCVESETLQELWAEKLDYGVSCSPCISSDVILLSAVGGRINCLLKKGRGDLWTYAARKTIGACPVIDGDNVFVTSEDGCLYSLNVHGGYMTDGRSWQKQTKARIVTSPVVYKQKVFVASLDQILYMFDELNGDLIDKYQIGQLVLDQPYASRNTVFFIGEEDSSAPRTMYAINATTGKCRWKRLIKGVGDKDYYEDGVPNVGKFLSVGKELVYVLSQDKSEIWGLRIADGQLVHKIPLSEKPDFIISQDSQHGMDVNNMGLIIMATKAGKVLVLKERRVY